MERLRLLKGSCSCGRYHFSVDLPADSPQPRVLFSSAHSLTLFVELKNSMPGPQRQPTLLRVPLANFQSTTFAHFPDESHTSIRRVYTPPQRPRSRHVFCGYCGASVSTWSEETQEEAEWICVTIASLREEGLEALEETGILDRTDLEKREGELTQREGEEEDLPWVEETTGAGMKKRVVKGKREEGGRRVEWEFTTLEEDPKRLIESGEGGPAKRKRGEVEGEGGGEPVDQGENTDV
ncbi:MAG: hypothetical protein M1833_003726 [Piccolia ochrophora]|nr:MAG: hypothetical protein M1833_003726 [Piccolia ochrophora]